MEIRWSDGMEQPASISAAMTDESDDNELNLPVPASSPCLQGERVAFTGTLASMTHRQAQELAAEHGGESTTHISRHTTMLVVGEEGWPLDDDGHPSVRLQKAVEQMNLGTPLQILRESEWLRLLGLELQQQLGNLKA